MSNDKELNEELKNSCDCEEQCEVETETEQETDKLAELEKKNSEYLDKLQRTLAEFDNFRKRTVKEKSAMYDDGVADTVLKLLPVIDNFERAVASYKPENSEAFCQGIEMILKQMQDSLTTLSVEPIEAIGEKFDPNRHLAISHTEDSGYGENEIIEDIQKGYKFKDRILRPSMVKVAN